MQRTLAEELTDPLTGAPLSLEVFEDGDNGRVREGVLRGPDGWYPIRGGVPRFLTGALRDDDASFAAAHGLTSAAAVSGRPRAAGTATAEAAAPPATRQAEQAKTNVTFSDKWTRFKQYGFEPAHQEFLNGWYQKKLGLETEDELRAFYAGKRAILEIGPGSGFNTRMMASATASTGGRVYAADISDAAVTTHDNTVSLDNVNVVQADLMNLPYPDERFDFIIADGVLHHTPDTRAAVEALYAKLAPGGQFFFYVYRRMGAARAFCDAYLREQWTGLEPDACYKACEGLTELGRELSAIKAKVTLKKGIPELGIPAGTHDVQRLLYYNFVKCFWNDAFDEETNNMVNFDWYHPHNAWQHSEDEVAGWLRDLGVSEFAFHPANPNGISALLRKPA